MANSHGPITTLSQLYSVNKTSWSGNAQLDDIGLEVRHGTLPLIRSIKAATRAMTAEASSSNADQSRLELNGVRSFLLDD
jgi:hypothetical protein